MSLSRSRRSHSCTSFFLFQFFRAFSRKAEDGIRMTSEYSELWGFLSPPGVHWDSGQPGGGSSEQLPLA